MSYGYVLKWARAARFRLIVGWWDGPRWFLRRGRQ